MYGTQDFGNQRELGCRRKVAVLLTRVYAHSGYISIFVPFCLRLIVESRIENRASLEGQNDRKQ